MVYLLSLIVHVISIIIWIGGVAFVTIIVFPMMLRMDSSLEQVLMFQRIEHRFSRIAKVMIILAGLSGVLLIYERALSFGVWVMIALWTFYALLIFGLEKILFARLFKEPTGEQRDMKKVFFMLQAFHWVVLTLSLVAVAAGIWTAHW